MKASVLDEYESISLSKDKYDRDSSDIEINELKQSVRLVNDTILMKSAKYPTIFQIATCFDRIEELTSELDEFYIIIDPSKINWPKFKLNRYAKKRYKNLNDKLIHVSIISGYSPRTNILAGFLIDIIFGKTSVSLHRNIKHAIKEQELIRLQLP